MGFILRQGWTALDFGEEREIAQLRRLWESIELEIIRVLEAINALKESPDYELHRLTAQRPAVFDETVRRYIEALAKEVAVLEREASVLAQEIEELTGEVVATQIKRFPLRLALAGRPHVPTGHVAAKWGRNFPL